jgi:hypothetical protein
VRASGQIAGVSRTREITTLEPGESPQEGSFPTFFDLSTSSIRFSIFDFGGMST